MHHIPTTEYARTALDRRQALPGSKSCHSRKFAAGVVTGLRTQPSGPRSGYSHVCGIASVLLLTIEVTANLIAPSHLGSLPVLTAVAEGTTRLSEIKEFSVSTNGDRWSLDMSGGETFVLHMGNEPSGGHETRTPLADFLRERAGKPEHAALLQVLGQSQDEVQHQLGEDALDTS